MNRLPGRARSRSAATTLMALFAAALLGTATAAPAAPPDETDNPCVGPDARQLLCPNLRIGPPAELYVQRVGGQVRLRATSDVRSRGAGPIELRGRRDGWRTMRTKQRIYRRGGGHLDLPSPATLRFTDVGSYFGGGYWKVHQLARFELWRVDDAGRRTSRVRVGPKLNYCLRDLERTMPGPRSPVRRHYPACNQDPYRDGVALGTSVGWSDIYPAPYHQQWIDVSGLRGCFSLRMIVDPQRLLYESDESDNASRRLVRLPYTAPGGC